MGFTKTIKNIWSIEDLRKRIGITLLLVIIYRFGCYVVLPGINPDELVALKNFTADGLMQLLDMFSGGAFSQASIFALGIMPYITASIVIQLLGMVLPAFQKMQREGESGRMKLKYQVQAAGGHVELGMMSIIFMTIVMAAGSMFIMWLGERIDQKGVGNGISFIILIGIIARLPEAFMQEFTGRLMNSAGGGLVLFLVEIVILLAVIAGAVLLVQGTRKVPVQYAKKVVGNKQYGGARNYIPLKVNAAGVMPIIFAQAIMFIPVTLIGFRQEQTGFFGAMTDMYGFWYNFVYFLMIVAFTYFYTAITVRPAQMAEEMKRNNGFIPGVKPGKPTVDYLDSIMSRITLPGSIFLGIVAILPAIAHVCGLNRSFASFFGGTSLLILVGVILDTLRIIEGHLLMHRYDGLMKDGRIKGRTTGNGAF